MSASAAQPPDVGPATADAVVPRYTETPLKPTAPPPSDEPPAARRALPALAVVYVVVFAGSGIQLPLTSLAMQHVGLSSEAIGLMWGARSLSAALMPVFFGLVADRLGTARPLLLASLGLGSVLLLWLSTTTSAATAVLIFALYGALTGPSGSLLDGMTLTALGPDKQRFGRWRAVGTVSFGVSTLVVTGLLDRGLLRPLPSTLFPLCALFAAAAAGVVAVLVPPLPRPALQDPRMFLAAFRQPLLLGLVALGAVLWCSHGAWASFLAPLVARAGLPARVIGFAVAFSVVVEAVAMSLAPQIVSRVGAARVLVACAVVACVRWILSSITTSPLPFVLLHGLHGVSFGLFFVVIVGVVAERSPPELRQASQGVLSSLCFGVGGFVGSLLCGKLMALDPGPALPWQVMAGIAAVAVVLSAFVGRLLR